MKKVPEATIRRLFYYYRCLKNDDSDSPKYICSDVLGNKTGIKSTLLRRDLSFFGHMGHKGKGYHRDELKNKLEKIMGIDHQHEIALIGAGNVGKALVKYEKFRELGLYITEIFDNDLDKIGRRIEGYIVKNVKFLKETLEQNDIKIVILAIGEEEIDEIINQLQKVDIKALWNLSSAQLNLDKNVVVIKEDLCCSIGSLIYKINN